MIGKYKIKYDGDIDDFEKIVKATVDTGILVFTWQRFKSLQEMRRNFCNEDFQKYSWFVIGFHPECCRVCSMVVNNWYRIGELEEITLEDFLKKMKA